MIAAHAPAIVDLKIATRHPAQLLQPAFERHSTGLGFRLVLGLRHQHADAPRALALLPARRERPRRSSATEERDELAPFHSITSSARASTVGGISRFWNEV